MLAHPGPGVDGPGPGVMMYGGPGGFVGPPGGMPTSQLSFEQPEAMHVRWDVSGPGAFDSEPLVVPGRQNFRQGTIYRLKLTNVPGRSGSELYPTVEVGPTTPRTDAFLSHNAIPIQFTAEDLDQVATGNFVTKVIYLPDPEFQALAVKGVETLVSTRLDPGVDPIVEADRRGAILAIVRLGNKDLQVPVPNGSGQVVPVAYGAAAARTAMAGGAPFGVPTAAFAPGAVPPHAVSGVNVPPWGMPMSGTPIGLPGPPHIPLGNPAGLQSHVMTNHTHMRIPGPTKQFSIDVRQDPGMSYPPPVRGVSIEEDVKQQGVGVRNPRWNRREVVHGPDCDCAECAGH